MTTCRAIEIVAVLPPIPLRRFDYCAFFADDPEGLQGHGATDTDALADLIEQSQIAEEQMFPYPLRTDSKPRAGLPQVFA